jgi:hypothetical protein
MERRSFITRGLAALAGLFAASHFSPAKEVAKQEVAVNPVVPWEQDTAELREAYRAGEMEWRPARVEVMMCFPGRLGHDDPLWITAPRPVTKDTVWKEIGFNELRQGDHFRFPGDRDLIHIATEDASYLPRLSYQASTGYRWLHIPCPVSAA